MLRSLQRLRAVPPGLESANTIAFELTLPWAKYGTYQDVLRFHRGLVDQVTALPGVVSAAMGPVPFREYGGCALIFVEDQPVVADERPRCVTVELVSPGYFQTLGIPLQGRSPGWSETEAATAGAVVTRALAQRLWPDQDPIGRGIRGNGWVQPFYRVVGVTGELRANGLDQPPTEAVFFPMVPIEGAPLWSPPVWSTLMVRTSGPGPEQLAGPVRRIVSSLDAAVPLGTIATMERVMAGSMARRSLVMLLLAIAGLMALVLSIVGLYGAVAYVVSRRTNEIGLRMALGARGTSVVAAVLRDALALGAGGALIGLAVAVAFTRVLRSLLFEVSPTDPPTLVAVTALLLATAAVASLVPARRAVRVAPMEALRHE
jgi:predicted permease